MKTCIYRGIEEFEIEVDIRGAYQPYRPAKTYGPPESCYPEEGGYCGDMIAVFEDGGKEYFINLTKDEEKLFEQDLAEELAEEADNKIYNMEYDDDYY